MAAILISAVFRWNGIITLFARRTIRSLSSWRIIRIGRSRRSVMQESLGYIDGGSMALIDSLVKAIEWQGGRIHVNSPVSKVTVANGCVTGVSIKPSKGDSSLRPARECRPRRRGIASKS
jgi:protoporphyrinogen oxidase